MKKFRIIENQYLDRIEFYPEYLSCVNVWKPIPNSSISNSYADAMIIIEQFKRMSIKPTISLVHYLNNTDEPEESTDDLLTKMIEYVQESYISRMNKQPAMLLGDVAELIKIATGKQIDYYILEKYSNLNK